MVTKVQLQAIPGATAMNIVGQAVEENPCRTSDFDWDGVLDTACCFLTMLGAHTLYVVDHTCRLKETH